MTKILKFKGLLASNCLLAVSLIPPAIAQDEVGPLSDDAAKVSAKVESSVTEAVTETQEIPVEDASAIPLTSFFAPTRYWEPKLSPNGKKLAVVEQSRFAGSNLMLVDLESYEMRSMTKNGFAHVKWFEWVSDNRVVVGHDWDNNRFRLSKMIEVITIDGDDFERTFPVSNKSGNHRTANENLVRGQSIEVLSTTYRDDDYILVSVRSKKESGKLDLKSEGFTGKDMVFTEVAQLNIRNGYFKTIEKNPGRVVHWLIDRQDRVRIAFAWEEDGRTRVLHKAPDGKKWEELYSYGIDEPGIKPIGFGADPNIVYVLSEIGRDTEALYSYDIANRQFVEELFAHDEADVRGILFSETEDRVVGAVYSLGYTHIEYFEEDRVALDAQLKQAFEGNQSWVKFSNDGKNAIVWIAGDKNPGRVYHYDKQANRLTELYKANSLLPEEKLSTTRPVTIAARDGVELQSYITAPEHAQNNGAMVVLIHGGPHGVRDYWGFDSEVQFLASRGYTVLQVNFRGSAGFGRSFAQQGWQQWGDTVQTDIADAVDYMIEEGLVDPNRICVYGASFGGYSAMMQLMRFPEKYRCGISFAGVTDLKLLMEQAEMDKTKMMKPYLSYVLGDGEVAAASLANNSPVNLIENLDDHVMIAYGVRDTVVPPEHSEKLIDAIERSGKHVYSLKLPKDGHGLYSAKSHMEFYGTLEKFLAAHAFSDTPNMVGSETHPTLRVAEEE